MSLNAIRENKILAKISEFTVFCSSIHKMMACFSVSIGIVSLRVKHDNFFSVETRAMNTKGPPFLSLFYDKHGSHLHGDAFVIAIKISKFQISNTAAIV